MAIKVPNNGEKVLLDWALRDTGGNLKPAALHQRPDARRHHGHAGFRQSTSLASI